jgi:hypothetical protein
MPQPNTSLEERLVGATDQDRAKILEQSGDEPGGKDDTNVVKQEMAKQEKIDAVSRLWSKVHDAVRAAETACREKKEQDSKADVEALFDQAFSDLMEVLQEMRSKDTSDLFDEMLEEANSHQLTLEPY